MKLFGHAARCCAPVLLVCAVASAAAVPFDGQQHPGWRRQEPWQAVRGLGRRLTADQSGSCNTPANRSCWTRNPSFDIHTDWAHTFPETGVVREYDFTITEVNNFVGGDGKIKKKAMLINGQFPGPTIEADWGDRIRIRVLNNLETNGTGIHWHGMFQMNNNVNDGVGGVTECPIPPRGGRRTYELLATQYGTGWYHSHFSVQYGNGVLGAMVVRGPASASYDVDLGAYTIADWYYDGADEIAERVADPATPGTRGGAPGSPPPSDNVLFNGTNVAARGGGGAYARTRLAQGGVHLLRLINPSVENSFSVSLTGHALTIVAADYVPVAPRRVASVFLGVGQRYDVLIHADQPPADYFLNVTYSKSNACGSSRNPAPAAIFSYLAGPRPASEAATAPQPPTRRQEAPAEDGQPGGGVEAGGVDPNQQEDSGRRHKHKEPKESPRPVPIPLPGPAPRPAPEDGPPRAAVADSRCLDLPDLSPIVPRRVPLELFEPGRQSSLDVDMKIDDEAARVFWTVNRSPMKVSWNEPTLSRVDAGSFDELDSSENVVNVPTADTKWSFWVIQNSSPIPHPMHLHGHDLVLVGQSTAPEDPMADDEQPRPYDDETDRAVLRPDNPTRRDTTMLPAWGWIVLAFETNNPGAWLFHCHLAWHASQGLSVQYLERPAEIPQVMNMAPTERNCEDWRAYYPQHARFRQQDSGI